MSIGRFAFIGIVIACLCLPASAALIVDGNLADWGATVADNNHSSFSTWTPGLNLLGYHIEDQDDHASHSFVLGPDRGGQDYDAEMMAVALQGDRYFISLVTGQRPDNGFSFYAPGDLRLETSAGIFGIEVGGGKGDTSYRGAITEGAQGYTYTLNGSGYTTSCERANSLQVAGSIWLNPDWILDPIGPHGPTQLKMDQAGTFVGLADYVFTRDAVTSQHAIIELSFDKSLLGNAALQGVYWRPSCGNDELNITRSPVPEPSTIVLLSVGTGLLLRRRR